MADNQFPWRQDAARELENTPVTTPYADEFTEDAIDTPWTPKEEAEPYVAPPIAWQPPVTFTPEPYVAPAPPQVMPDFESGSYADGFAVASGKPGISGRWVKGATRDEAIAAWRALYESGDLDEAASA